MITKAPKNKLRIKRHYRVRTRVNGTQERPRLNVFRSTKHIYAQIIDDITGKTLVAASTVESGLKGDVTYGGNLNAAAKIGKVIAERALSSGISKVVFDRGGYIYHGRVKALADAAREAGLDF